MCVSHACAQKRGLGLLGLAFQTVVSYHVSAGKQIRPLVRTASAPNCAAISPGPDPWLWITRCQWTVVKSSKNVFFLSKCLLRVDIVASGWETLVKQRRAFTLMDALQSRTIVTWKHVWQLKNCSVFFLNKEYKNKYMVPFCFWKYVESLGRQSNANIVS